MWALDAKGSGTCICISWKEKAVGWSFSTRKLLQTLSSFYVKPTTICYLTQSTNGNGECNLVTGNWNFILQLHDCHTRNESVIKSVAFATVQTPLKNIPLKIFLEFFYLLLKIRKPFHVGAWTEGKGWQKQPKSSGSFEWTLCRTSQKIGMSGRIVEGLPFIELKPTHLL